jgi:nicotinate phosphoribosyltransferase
MDIVSMKTDDVWKPVAKRGKFSGRKDVWRCPKCARTQVTPLESKAPKCHTCGLPTELASIDLVKKGEIITPTRSPKQIRESVLEQLEKVSEKE